ncbi:enamine deaminase RidA (YjgF/YER057c/UK114 family) [Virgibacillus natechei]|uniref:Enamine deaminase RidA (YjgF/YER057c/UK114 family) n=1 Tax=Virgibacillus natechei TaxID=1216297 RepID=A0ABS4IL70_9BACI|nr:RidA family protein [Virgibacillus natechei]MBP1971722.1 enamine deaminase RidA (YjgF/YER057c/UK114 family) [Virgibacillus natechei]UZD12141.1 RidA family protein [Virgibacillus natechei]
MSVIDKRLKELGIELPEVSAPPASFIHAVTTGNLVYTSGNDCKVNGEFMYTGKLGKELTIEEGSKAARQTMINLLAVLKDHLGNLDRINKVVKVLAFVNSAPGFNEQPYVVNGASQLLEQIFGENGKHARTGVGTNELPFSMPVEIEMIVELKPE